MNCTIGQILHAHLLDKDQKHWANYIAVTEIAINSTNNVSNNKAIFEVFYSENILFPVNLLLCRESSIIPHAYTFAIKMN